MSDLYQWIDGDDYVGTLLRIRNVRAEKGR